jgi:hypothetical protein
MFIYIYLNYNFYNIILFKKISLKKYAWSFCMGSLPSMERERERERDRETERQRDRETERQRETEKYRDE